MVKLAIVIVSFNTKAVTLDCLESIFSQKWQTDFQVWVVDNASSDESAAAIKKQFPAVKLIESPENIGFAGGNNLALKQAKAEYYLLLNSDTRVGQGALDQLVDCAEKNNWGVASAKLLNPDGSFQPGGGQLPSLGNLFKWLSGLDDLLGLSSYQMRREADYQAGKVGWVGGTAMLIRQTVIDKIGVLDDKIFMYGEDVEYCLRAQRAKFKVGWCEGALVVHLGGISSKGTAKYNQWLGEFRGLLYIYQKYYGKLYWLLKLLIYLFTMVRVVAFGLLGRKEIAKTYVKVIQNL